MWSGALCQHPSSEGLSSWLKSSNLSFLISNIKQQCLHHRGLIICLHEVTQGKQFKWLEQCRQTNLICNMNQPGTCQCSQVWISNLEALPHFQHMGGSLAELLGGNQGFHSTPNPTFPLSQTQQLNWVTVRFHCFERHLKRANHPSLHNMYIRPIIKWKAYTKNQMATGISKQQWE